MLDLYFFKSFFVAGFGYYEGSFVFDELKVGTPIELVLDANNIYDDNAVELRYNNTKIGFIPKESNKEIATLLKAGYSDIFKAVIQQISPNKHPEQQIKIGVFIKNKKRDN